MIRGSHGWWGALGGLPQNGVVSYAISPFRQRAFKGFMSQDMSHMLGGATNELKYMLPALLLGYGMYKYSQENYEYRHSKEFHSKEQEAMRNQEAKRKYGENIPQRLNEEMAK